MEREREERERKESERQKGEREREHRRLRDFGYFVLGLRVTSGKTKNLRRLCEKLNAFTPKRYDGNQVVSHM